MSSTQSALWLNDFICLQKWRCRNGNTRHKKILYATDLSENSRHAFACAAGIANRFDAEVTILHVIEELSRVTTDRIAVFAGDEVFAKIRKRKEQDVVDIIKKGLKIFMLKSVVSFPNARILQEKPSLNWACLQT